LRRHLPFRTFDDAFAWLAARTNYETMATQRYDARTYGLARVERLLAAVGRPDRAYDVTQVVGSKGKGSTAAALAGILRASGRKVGLFTSPHLVDPRERIRIDGRPAPDRLVRDALASLVPRVEDAARRGEPLTFFEVHTVAALLVFRAARCDAVVLEAGMGGRLDATTAADAVCKVLTSVSLDHTQHLGRTRASIAREKAAAARRGVPFVSGEPPSSAAGRVVAAACRRAGAPLVALGRDFRVAGVRTSFDRATRRASTTFRIVPGSVPGLRGLTGDAFEVPMLGTHQARNAALAAVAATRARWSGGPVRPEHVRRGLARTTVRARLESLPGRPLVLVDGAHNPASFGVLARAIRVVAPTGPRVFVVGMAADKDVRGSLRRLRGVATRVVATTSGQARALSPGDLARTARSVGLRAAAAPDPRAALRRARREAGRDGAVVVTGSLYLCGAVLSL
jgi:dihydrofolate synthase / folylpolyglutamate synthase